MNTKRKIKSTQIVTILCPIYISIPIPHNPYPYPRNKKLIGFGSFKKVNLKLAGGSGPLDPPPRPATPLILHLFGGYTLNRALGAWWVHSREKR